jgi:hypothetical protein
MLAAHHHVPRIHVEAPATATVTAWGQVAGLVLRPGDRLVLGGARDGLVLLVPRGYGRPMLGRVTPRGLVAEPGGVPASAARWSVAGGVVAIERSLERGAGLPAGSWFVRLCVQGGGTSLLALSDMENVARSAEDAEALLRRALLAARRDGLEVQVGIAQDGETASWLAESATTGHARIALVAPKSSQSLTPAGRVIAGPWAGPSHPRQTAPASRLLPPRAPAPRAPAPRQGPRGSGRPLAAFQPSAGPMGGSRAIHDAWDLEPQEQSEVRQLGLFDAPRRASGE